MLVVLVLPSCLFENDLSYPKMDADILSFKVEGQTSVVIDKDNREVVVEFEETADLTRIRINEITVSEGARIVEDLPQYKWEPDISSPMTNVNISWEQSYHYGAWGESDART